MVTARPTFWPNLTLALLLFTIIGSWFWLAPPDPAVQLAYMLLALTTGGLAIVALIRPPARNRDERWWVLAICLVSMLYAFGYRFDGQPRHDARTVFRTNPRELASIIHALRERPPTPDLLRLLDWLQGQGPAPPK